MPEPLKAVVPHWNTLDLDALVSNTLVAGFEVVDELEMMSKLLGAQMLAKACGGLPADYLRDSRNAASPRPGDRAATISRRLHEWSTIANPDICFADSQAVVAYVGRLSTSRPGSRRYEIRPQVVDLSQKATKIHIATATRLTDEEGDTKGFAGLNFTLDLGYKSRKIKRWFLPGVKVATSPDRLYPNTTTFAFE